MSDETPINGHAVEEQKQPEQPVADPSRDGPPSLASLPVEHQRHVAHQSFGMLLVIDRARKGIGDRAANLRTRSLVDPKNRSECLIRCAEAQHLERMLMDLQSQASKVLAQCIAIRPEFEAELGIMKRPQIMVPGGV